MTSEEAIAECLAICEMFADENIRMAGDTIALDPLLKRALLRRNGEAPSPMTAADLELCERLQIEGCVHSAMHHAALNIAAAIRERFNLPPASPSRQDEEPQ